MAKRIWVIDVPKDWSPRDSRAAVRSSSGIRRGHAGAASLSSRHASRDRAGPRPTHRNQQREWQVALAYVLGPLGLPFTRPGGGSMLWAGLGAGSIIAMTWMAARRGELLTRVEESGMSALMLIIEASVIIMLGFVAWARAVFEVGRNRRPTQPERGRSPRRPALLGALGLLFPGLGLLLTGHRLRAAWATAAVGPTLASLLVLAHAGWLWTLDRSHALVGMSPHTLEILFLASALILAVGIVFWFVQALEGARLAAQTNARRRAVDERLLWLFLATWMVFALVFQPARAGRDLDHFAMEMQLGGFRLIPLCLELGASRLDPSMPAYALRAAELYDELGWTGSARALRADLDSRWATYSWMLRHPAGKGSPPTGAATHP